MKGKSILVNNGALGRMGKTFIAYTLYKTAKEPFKYVTNDLDNASINLKKNVQKDDFQYVKDDEEINVDPNDNIIFDFGGKPDERLLEVAQFVDFVIVPLAYQSSSELQLTIKNINALKEQNRNIIALINNTDKEESGLLKGVLQGSFDEEEIEITILEISHSKYVRRLANEGNTIYEVAALNKRDAGSLNRKIIPQFNELFNILEIEK